MAEYTLMRPVQPHPNRSGKPFVQLFPGGKPSTWWVSEKMYPHPHRKNAIIKLAKRKKVLGERWYLIRSQWMEIWSKFLDGDLDYMDECPSVCNQPLTNSLGRLSGNVSLDSKHVHLVPLEAWKLLVQWCVS